MQQSTDTVGSRTPRRTKEKSRSKFSISYLFTQFGESIYVLNKSQSCQLAYHIRIHKKRIPLQKFHKITYVKACEIITSVQ